MQTDAEDEPKTRITGLIGAFAAGDSQVKERLFAAIYDELRGLAQSQLGSRPPADTLQKTEIVHEAYFRLSRQRFTGLRDRGHFFSIAVRIIRRVLADHARARRAEKRGGDAGRNPLSQIVDAHAVDTRFHEIEVLDLEEALTELATKSPPRARVVELRFYAGLSVAETAEVMGVSTATVKRHWQFGQAWLLARLDGAR